MKVTALGQRNLLGTVSTLLTNPSIYHQHEIEACVIGLTERRLGINPHNITMEESAPLLGLDLAAYEAIFSKADWPDNFKERFDSARQKRTEAYVAALRTLDLIARGENKFLAASAVAITDVLTNPSKYDQDETDACYLTKVRRVMGFKDFGSLREYLGFPADDNSVWNLGTVVGGDILSRFFWAGQIGWPKDARRQFKSARTARTRAKLGTIQFIKLVLELSPAN